jgi:hypothetical protein
VASFRALGASEAYGVLAEVLLLSLLVFPVVELEWSSQRHVIVKIDSVFGGKVGQDLGDVDSTLPFLFWRVSIGRLRSPVGCRRGEPR